MCGIVGYIGKQQAFPILLSGLIRLEYRGYDSFGFCVLDDAKSFIYKKKGKISEEENKVSALNMPGNIGIAHTRWATTGKVSDANAHPHWDCEKKIFVAHNGIIENYKEIREMLLKEGHKFITETDTEVLAHLIEKHFNKKLEDAVKSALKEVRGTYGLAVISARDPQKIVVARMSSPLLIGIAPDGYIVASDPMAVIAYTDKVIYLDDYEIATITPNGVLTQKEKIPQIIDINPEKAGKEGYEHFMLKEIMEEPQAVENAIMGRLDEAQGDVNLGGLKAIEQKLKNISRLKIIACGTSYYAGLLGQFLLEEYGNIPASAELASEFRHKQGILSPDMAGIFVSQSGETADTLGALKEIKNKGILTLGITNVIGSTQSREVDAGVYLRSGPEIAVASTKAFIGQASVFAMLAVFFGRRRKMDMAQGKNIISELKKIPDLIRKILENKEKIKLLAQKYGKYKNFFFLGRKFNLPVAYEGALKLKEISYIHAEGLAGGEVKHGPLSLIDENFISVAICPDDSVYDKILVNIEEIIARGGKVIAVASEGNKDIGKVVEDVIYIPKTIEMLNPILAIVPLHLFAYYMALTLGREVDKPRNLAKSVTVE